MPSNRLIPLLTALFASFLPAFAAAHPQDPVRPAPPHDEEECTGPADLDVRPFASRTFQNIRRLRVLLPPGYNSKENKSRRYPVLYLNDGQNLFDVCTSTFIRKEWRVDETLARLIEAEDVGPLIVVGIDSAEGTERAAEYLPYPDAQLGTHLHSVQGRKYARFLMRDVMPFINHQYRTLTGPENTALGGSSYGAAAALYAVMTHPGVFGRVLLESPPLYLANLQLLRDSKTVKSWPQRVYVGIGTNEAGNEQGNREAVRNVEVFAGILQGAGLGDDRLLVVVEKDADHSEDAWARRFPRAVRFLFAGTAGAVPASPPPKRSFTARAMTAPAD
jgi:predicted alpha/beta superfamily hydrolase